MEELQESDTPTESLSDRASQVAYNGKDTTSPPPQQPQKQETISFSYPAAAQDDAIDLQTKGRAADAVDLTESLNTPDVRQFHEQQDEMAPPEAENKPDIKPKQEEEEEVEEGNVNGSLSSFWWLFVAGSYARISLKGPCPVMQGGSSSSQARKVTCEDCDATFSSMPELEEHALTHIGSYVYTCSACQKTFTKLSLLRRHQSTHENREAYTCMGCQQGFFFYSKLKNHQLVCEAMLNLLAENQAEEPAPAEPAEPEMEEEESMGPRRTRRKRRRRQLFTIKRTKSTKRRQLDDGTFVEEDNEDQEESYGEDDPIDYAEDAPRRRRRRRFRRSSLTASFKDLDPDKTKICRLCPEKPEIENQSMEQHLKEYHPERILRCRICNTDETIFFKDEHYRRHYRREHPGKHWFECNVCGRSFKSRDRWQQHEFLHTGLKHFACDKCPKKFAFKSYLDKHFINCHKGRELTYFCEKCGKGFKYGHTYKRHMLEHQGRNYPCPICNFFFLTPADLEKHRIVHMNIQRYFCETCGKGFKHRTGHDEHLKTHLPKTLQCEHCPMMFNRKENMIRHQEVHTGKKAGYCQFCQKGFRKKSRLRKHILTIHSNEHNLQLTPKEQAELLNPMPKKPPKPRQARLEQPPQQLTPCPLCDKLFATQAGLSAHMKTHESFGGMNIHYQPNPPNPIMNPIVNPIMNPVYHHYIPHNQQG